MRSPIFLVCLCLISASWVVFVSFELIQNARQLNFRDYLNSEDKQIVVIHNLKEINWEAQDFQILSENKAVFFAISKKVLGKASIFLSKKRKLILIERDEKWQKKDVLSIFGSGLFPLKLNRNKEFIYGKYNGKYNENQLILYQDKLPLSKQNGIEVDNKASYSLINYYSSQFKVSDFYNKPYGSYCYTKSKFTTDSILPFDDKKIFSGILPLNFTNYSFFSSSYLNEIDLEYRKSHFQKCVDKGLVIIEDKGRLAAFFYFKDGQNPIQYINEKLHIQELNGTSAQFKNLAFSTYFKQNKFIGLFVEQFTNFVIVSNDKLYLDELVMSINVGESLSQNEKKINYVYRELPEKVCFRKVTTYSRKTEIIFDSSLLETEYIPLNRIIPDSQNQDKDYFSMNLGEQISDFIALDERGNVIVLTESNKLVGFVNGLRKWEKQLTKSNILIKEYSSNKHYFSLIVNNECQVFDKNGRMINRLMSSNGNVSLNYEINKQEFLAINGLTNFALFNDKGAIIKQFSSAQKIKQTGKYSVNGNLQLAILTTNMLYTLNPTNRSITKKITCDSLFQLYCDNSFIAYAGIQNNILQIMSYTGSLKSIKLNANSTIVGHYFEDKNLVLLIKTEKSLMAINQNGIKKWTRRLPVSEISSCSVRKAINGIHLIGILDALENKIYLLNSNGEKIDNEERKGSGKIQVTRFGENAFSISVILGNTVIQYTNQ